MSALAAARSPARVLRSAPASALRLPGRCRSCRRRRQSLCRRPCRPCACACLRPCSCKLLRRGPCPCSSRKQCQVQTSQLLCPRHTGTADVPRPGNCSTAVARAARPCPCLCRRTRAHSSSSGCCCCCCCCLCAGGAAAAQGSGEAPAQGSAGEPGPQLPRGMADKAAVKARGPTRRTPWRQDRWRIPHCRVLVARHVFRGRSKRVKQMLFKIRSAKSSPGSKQFQKTKHATTQTCLQHHFPLLENITS